MSLITNVPAGAPSTPNSASNSFNATNNDPRLIVVDDAMSLTRANITGWNKSDIESIMFREVGLDKVIVQAKEARMAGSVQHTLMDLLLSRHVPLKQVAGQPSQSVIQPFDLVRRRNRVNPGYFRVSAGASTIHADYTAAGLEANYTANGGVAAAHWTVTVNNGSLDADSSWLAKSPNNVLKNIEKFFLPRNGVTMEWTDPTSNAKYTSVMKVIGAFNVDANQAKVILAPNKTYAGYGNFPGGNVGSVSDWYGSATTPQKAAYQPATGIARLQANSVHDGESYGSAVPGFNEWGLVEYWPQTLRTVSKWSNEYLKALNAANTSEGLKAFRLLPLAQLKKQQQLEHDRQYFETCFYGDAEDENQTTQLWQNLPVVYDPAWAASD